MKSAKIMAVVAALGFVSASAFATTVGYVSVTVNAGSSGVISPVFEQSPDSSFVGLTSGTLETVTSTTLGDDQGAWATNFPSSTEPYFIKITSGTGEGLFFQIVSNTATLATLGGTETKDPTAFGIGNGDSYEIVPGETLASEFALADVIEGASAGVADQVFVYNQGAGSWTGNFRDTNGDWKSGFLTTNTTVLRPDQGVFFVRYDDGSSGAITLLSSGSVTDDDHQVSLPIGQSFVTLAFPTDTTFIGTGIQNSTNWNSSDSIFVFSGGSWTSATWNGSNWVSGFLTVSSNAITAGTPVFVVKTGTAGVYTRTNNL